MKQPYKSVFNKAVEFGEELLSTQDLDPIYVALYRVKNEWGEQTLARWLLAYWCFYHAGVACWLAQYRGPRYWAHFKQADVERFPRSAERRHFRGYSSANTIEWFHQNLTPIKLYRTLQDCQSYDDVAEVCSGLPLFGPWITFKIADMLERVCDVPIEFDEAVLNMYRDPQQGASLVMTGRIDTTPKPEHLHDAVHHMQERLGNLFAPPLDNRRRVGLQEIETVLCKFKSYWKGNYYVGKDIKEIRHGILKFAQHAPLNKMHHVFLEALPREVA